MGKIEWTNVSQLAWKQTQEIVWEMQIAEFSSDIV
jgi:hypothetical protein